MYLLDWYGAKDEALRAQYDQLADHLRPVRGGEAFQQIDHAAYREYRATHTLLLEEQHTDAAAGDPAQGSGG